MRTIIRIMKSELRVLFFSPIAWFILIVFSFQVGLAFSNALESQLWSQNMGYRLQALSLSLFGGYLGIYTKLLEDLYLYIPLFTMGLMSRELNSGSIKLLYSSPVSNIQIILGKYFAALIYAALLCCILLFPIGISVFSIKSPDVPVMFVGLLGVFLTISAYAAIGLFMSTITKYQVVAVVSTLAMLAILNFVGDVGREYDFVRDITYWLCIAGRSKEFLAGMISTKDVLYFLLVIFLFLSMSIIKLQGERLKLSKWNTSLRYGSVLFGVLMLGYISSLPVLSVYYDSTETKLNTLTEESQKVVKQLDGDLKITTYVNYLDETYDKGAPRNRIYDLKKFEKYMRFKPEIEMEYVYYYAPGHQYYEPDYYKNMTLEEIVAEKCKYAGYDPKRFLPLSEVQKQDDVAAENGRLFRVLSANEKKSVLRIYKDNDVDPYEAQITTALKRLLQKVPVVGFISGHKERSCEDMGEKGYGTFATERTFRYSLLNSGFDVREITLQNPVPADIDIIVLADMRTEMTADEDRNFQEYLGRGGNMFILGEPKRQHLMNPVLAHLGLRFEDGILVTPSDIQSDDLIAATITADAIKVSEGYERFIKLQYTITTPSACAVEVVDSTKGFDITKVLVTPSKGSWVEKETVDFVNEKSRLNPEKGEIEKSNAVMLYLTRPVGDKEQRIFVIGDADCIGTLELLQNRPGFRSSNFTLITETFRNMSYGEFPVETVRVTPPDDKVYISKDGVAWVKIGLMGVIPVLLVAGCVSLLIRRKRR